MTSQQNNSRPYKPSHISVLMVEYRKKHQLAHQALAESLGISETMVIDIETGRIPVVSMQTYNSIVSKIF